METPDYSYKKEAPPQYFELLKTLWAVLGYPYDRHPILVGVDGRDGVGKTSLATWLAWQLGVPVIHLDLYLKVDGERIEFRSDELRNAIKTRLSETRPRPLVVEGVLLLKALKDIDYKPNYLIFVGDNDASDNKGRLSSDIKEYFKGQDPYSKADFRMDWKIPELGALSDRS